MKDSSGRWIALAILLVLLILLVPTVALPAGREAWMRVSRAVVANQTNRHDFQGKPVSFLSVGGPRWVSWSEQKQRQAAYHVLLLLPSGSVTDNGWSGGSHGYRHSATTSWLVQTGGRVAEARFEARYDPVWRTVRIGERRYSLSNGNVFVVRLGAGSRPGVAQIDTTIAELDAADALEGAVKSGLRGDEVVQRTLRDLHRYDDCESGKPPAAGGTDEKKS